METDAVILVVSLCVCSVGLLLMMWLIYQRTIQRPVPPKIGNRVARKGHRLYLNNERFRFSGPNVFWLGLDYDEFNRPSYPNERRIEEAFQLAASMKARVIRSHTLAVSFGKLYSCVPKLGENNKMAWDTIDFAISMARKYDIYLIIPLVDFHDYYHVSYREFNPSITEFYANTESFKAYIKQWMTHINPITKTTLGYENYVLALETANEMGGWRMSQDVPPRSWVDEIAKHIKSLNPEMLVVNGTDGVSYEDLDSIDILTAHSYPRELSFIEENVKKCQRVNKPLYIGEYPCKGPNQKDELIPFLNFMSNTDIICGDSFWSMYGKNGDNTRIVRHIDDKGIEYTVYPQDPNDANIVKLLTNHAVYVQRF
jgi:mannan endo-1,4-beta-mannosidase